MKLKKSILRFLITIITGLLFFPVIIVAQQWDVPAGRSARLSPFEFSDSTITAGKEIFRINCLSCHGNPGENNFQALVPPPGDPATNKFSVNNDGSLYYKISEGRGLMPSFKNVFTSYEIWNVISYIRSFHSGYVQSVAEEMKLKDMKWSFIKIILSCNNENSSIIATLTGLEGDRWTPVPGIAIQLSAKRAFGHMVIDEPKLTNDSGMAEFEFPASLPGDREGKIELLARVTDVETFGSVSTDTVVVARAANDAPSLVEERAMWNTVRKAPVWIIILFPAAILIIWGFIVLVLINLRAIYLDGVNEDDE